MEISKVLSLIPSKPSKKVLEKSKYFKEKNKMPTKNINTQSKQLYMQVFSANIKEIVKIKENFSNLLSKKIYKVIKKLKKEKPSINMTSIGLLRRQVLVPMSQSNSSKFMVLSCKHIVNINRALKDIKSDTMANFIHVDHQSLTITTNKVASLSNLSIIEKYIKNIDVIESDNIMVLILSQLKSHLKILGIPYLIKDTNVPITSDVAKRIIKSTYIFNNVILTSKPRVIKVSPKSDMVVIWINIWDSQSRAKAKGLINRYFNVGSYITTIHGTNMNPGISQCKNCWKWRHITFSCCSYEPKCVKYNGPHKVEYH